MDSIQLNCFSQWQRITFTFLMFGIKALHPDEVKTVLYVMRFILDKYKYGVKTKKRNANDPKKIRFKRDNYNRRWIMKIKYVLCVEWKTISAETMRTRNGFESREQK